jgi:DNA-binding Xre family transcriptional regulator
MKNPHIGSTFESFLEEHGIQDEVDLLAQKRVIAWQIEQAMAEENISKVDMATRMKTSRSQVDRLLDPQNNRVQLDTLQRAAMAVGRSLKVELDKTRSAGRRDHVHEREQAPRGQTIGGPGAPGAAARRKRNRRRVAGK